eukprot:gene42427-29893_t
MRHVASAVAAVALVLVSSPGAAGAGKENNDDEM